MHIVELSEKRSWEEIAQSLTAHPLQRWSWAELKCAGGLWTTHRIAVYDHADAQTLLGAAQILVRKLPAPLGCLAYVPRGPVVSEGTSFALVANAVAAWCKEHIHPLALKIEPPLEQLELTEGWQKASSILMETTACLDLTLEEEALNKSLASKSARKYIRRALREGVEIRRATRDDLPRIMELYKETAAFDGFGIHHDAYYYQAFDIMEDINQLSVATIEGQVEAFLWNVVSPWGAFELWGAVSQRGKEMRANYPLKWQAMLDAKAAGAAMYDMNGLLNDGVSTFKMRFQDKPTVWCGTYDKPLSWTYGLWNGALWARKTIKNILHPARLKKAND